MSRRKNFKDYMYGVKFTTHKGNIYTFKSVNRISGRTAKIYNLHCNICSKDKVMWPHGSITSSKANIFKNKAISCGCSDKVSYKTFQWKIKIDKHCKDYCPDYKLHSWEGENLTFCSKLTFERSDGTLEKIYTTDKFLSLTEPFSDTGCYGYYSMREAEVDYLYVLLIESLDYFKVGRSFEPDRRLKENRRKINNFYKKDYNVKYSYLFQSDHKTIFNLEQILIKNRSGLFDRYRPPHSYGSSELIDQEYYNEVVNFCREYIDEWWK